MTALLMRLKEAIMTDSRPRSCVGSKIVEVRMEFLIDCGSFRAIHTNRGDETQNVTLEVKGGCNGKGPRVVVKNKDGTTAKDSDKNNKDYSLDKRGESITVSVEKGQYIDVDCVAEKLNTEKQCTAVITHIKP
jgi:hypothetical protein